VLESRSKGTGLLAGALADLASSGGPRILLSGSAVGFYGDRGDDVMTEADGPGDQFVSSVCRAWEDATAPAARAGLRVARMRTGIVLAASGGVLKRTLPLFKLGLGGRLGNGRQWFSWISLTDEVAAIRFLLQRDVEGPVNLTAPEPVTNAAYTKALGAALHRPTVLPVPGFAPGLVFGRELVGELLLTGQRVVPAVLQAEGFGFAHPTVDAAIAAALHA
jgi:uncharacterized protein (TIGR01777 family)